MAGTVCDGERLKIRSAGAYQTEAEVFVNRNIKMGFIPEKYLDMSTNVVVYSKRIIYCDKMVKRGK
jgi:hypothetical protein